MRRSPLLVLLILTGAVHASALSGGFVYDDLVTVTGNAALQRGDVAALVTMPFLGDGANWRPIASLALWLGNAVGAAGGIHATALAAHLVATMFAWRVLQRAGLDARAAFVAALWFGIHPVQVEGVAWCSAVNDPLWHALGLACVDSAMRGRAVAAALLALAALLAKENALVVVPLAVAASAIAGTRSRRLVAAMAAAVAVWWSLRALVFGGVAAGLGQAAIDPVIAAQWPLAAVETFGRELELLVWPWPQSPFRALHLDPASAMRGAAWGMAWLGSLVVAVRRGARVVVFALCVVGAEPLLVALRCHALGASPVADRYAGLAVLGGAMLAVPRLRAGFGAALLAVLSLGFAFATVTHTRTFRDEASLVAHGLEAEPGDARVQMLAGNCALEAGQIAAATDHFSTALRLAGSGEPKTVVRAVVVDASIGLAWCRLRGERPEPRAAAEMFARVLLDAPDVASAWIGLGVANGMAGDAAAAERALRRAIELAPGDTRAHHNLAFLLAQTGRRQEARASAAAALQCDPNNAAARSLLESLR
ncbi:MAG: tetratricopeptide repeat protein [Planctomycetes bacterium]|nr:tetratricopeptide repeat protein [Planctomycetota bacterium]